MTGCFLPWLLLEHKWATATFLCQIYPSKMDSTLKPAAELVSSMVSDKRRQPRKKFLMYFFQLQPSVLYEESSFSFSSSSHFVVSRMWFCRPQVFVCNTFVPPQCLRLLVFIKFQCQDQRIQVDVLCNSYNTLTQETYPQKQFMKYFILLMHLS